MVKLVPSMNTWLSLWTSLRKLIARLDNEFVALYIVCWMALGAVVFWWNRRSCIRSFPGPSTFSQTARLLFQRTFKVQKTSSARRKRRAPASRKCCYLVFLLLLLSAFVLRQTISRTSNNGVDKEGEKIGFVRVQTVMDELIATDGVTLRQIVESMESLIVEWFPVLACDEDKSLLQQQPVQERVFVAANLFNCAELMPNFVLQLLTFVSLFDEDQIRVSIYESGSTDLTPSWLDLLQKILIASNITSTIIVGGELVRDPEEDRIEFLAQIRNEAIAPMLEWSRGPSPWTAQKVAFINDVYFCPQHILRLLVHKDEDVVCGMDFVVYMGLLPSQVHEKLMVQDLNDRFLLPKALIRHLAKVKFLRLKWRQFLSSGDLVRLKVPVAFYDRWATTDINGINLQSRPPFTTDALSKELVPGGFPFYVHTCWNGLAALNAKPLLQSKQPILISRFWYHVLGLKFRARYKDECEQSECFFICHDYSRLGFDRIMIDPGVRVAYEYVIAQALYDSNYVKKLPFVPWDAKGVRDHSALTRQHPTNVSCCVLPDGERLGLDECSYFDYSNYQFPKMADL